MPEFKSAAVMGQLKERIAKEGKDYVKKVGGTYLFAVTKVSYFRFQFRSPACC